MAIFCELLAQIYLMFYNVLKSIINIIMSNSKRNKKRRYNKKQRHKAYKLNDFIYALTNRNLLKDNFNNDTKKFNNWYNSKNTNIEHSRINRQVSNRLINPSYEELENCEKLGFNFHELERWINNGYDVTKDKKINDYSTVNKNCNFTAPLIHLGILNNI